jgi:hypothetical protein
MIKDKNYEHLNKIDQWIYDMEYKKCLNCKGFDTCNQTNKGMTPVIMENKYSSVSKYILASKNQVLYMVHTKKRLQTQFYCLKMKTENQL